MKRLVTILFIILAALAVVFVLGPRPQADQTLSFDASRIGGDLDEWLAQREAAIADLRPGTEKRLVWANPAGKAQTEWAVVYIHGFSATLEEIRPVPDRVAERLGANLFFTRLSGHGRNGQALAEATMNDWINDTAEAIAIAKRLGKRVMLVTASTGGTLATFAAANAQLAGDIDALVLVSPNYAVHGATIGLLNMPWAETVLPMMMGQTRSWEPENEAHGKWWTTSYPSQAVFTMGALLKTVEAIDKSEITTPALFIFSPDDQVIVPKAVREVAGQWGGPAKSIEITDSGDPSHHIIAGDILSPQTTKSVVDAIVEWAQSL